MATRPGYSPEEKRAYYRANLDKWKQYKIDWNTANPAKVLYNSAKGRSKKRGTEFTISVSDVVIPEVCPVFGTKICTNWKPGGHRAPNWDAPSLDRIDPNRGYVPGNVRVISWRANDLKRTGTLEEMRLIVADLERIRDR